MTTTVGNKQGRTQTMKKIFFAISVLAVAFGFTACSNEDEVIENEQNNNEFITAFTEPGTTRTALDGNDKDGYEVVWSEGDQFYAYKYDYANARYIKAGTFTLVSESGLTTGTFQKDKGKDLVNVAYTAYYPTEYMPTGYMGVNWPTTQTYTEGNITGFPMKAIHEAGSSTLKFTNEGGILRLAVKGTATVKSIKVRAQGLATITLNCGDGVALTPEGKLFHIAMPTGETSKTYTDVEITLTGTDDKEICTKKFKGTNGLVIERSKITKASFSTYKAYKEGDKVTIDGHDGIVVNIDGKLVIVATMNVGATAVTGPGCLGDRLAFAKTYTGWEGWRLPSVDEMETFCSSDYPNICGNTEGGEDRFKEEGGSGSLIAWYIDGDDVLDLYLPLNGYEPTELGDYPYDKYWTGPAGNDGKYFYFAPEINWEGDGGFTYYPIAYGYRELPYKEEAAIDSEDSKFLVRLFHDLP